MGRRKRHRVEVVVGWQRLDGCGGGESSNDAAIAVKEGTPRPDLTKAAS